jgi:prepilin-type processing-associated H-X9-DG protein
MCLLFTEYLQKIIYVFVIHIVFTENHLCVCYSRSIYRKSSICVCYSRSIYRKSSMCLSGADHLIFEGGLEDFEKKFPAIQVERKKKSCSIQSRKKKSCKSFAAFRIFHLYFYFNTLNKGLNVLFVDGNGLNGRITRPNCLWLTKWRRISTKLRFYLVDG